MWVLTEDFSTAVYYSDVVGMRYKEIAEVMDTTGGTPHMRVSRWRDS
ncbi:DNA-directed RNA polymerase specialized sigma24 family protein [Mycobacterium sp. URHB0021]|jgi:RNA polymerase sigma-70 factor (ECF subfamily)